MARSFAREIWTSPAVIGPTEFSGLKIGIDYGRGRDRTAVAIRDSRNQISVLVVDECSEIPPNLFPIEVNYSDRTLLVDLPKCETSGEITIAQVRAMRDEFDGMIARAFYFGDPPIETMRIAREKLDANISRAMDPEEFSMAVTARRSMFLP